MAWFKSKSDTWASATGKEASLPTIYRYRQNRPAKSQPDALPNALRVVWPYDGAARNGMPEPRDNEAQIAFEDAIEPLTEGPRSHLMLVFTGNSRKEWLFYTGDCDAWAASLTKLLAKHPPYPLKLTDWADPSWSTWQKFVDGVSGES